MVSYMHTPLPSDIVQIHQVCLGDNGGQKANVSASARQDADNRHLFSFAAL